MTLCHKEQGSNPQSKGLSLVSHFCFPKTHVGTQIVFGPLVLDGLGGAAVQKELDREVLFSHEECSLGEMTNPLTGSLWTFHSWASGTCSCSRWSPR